MMIDTKMTTNVFTVPQSKRLKAACFVAQNIRKSKTIDHLAVAKKLVENFFKLHDPTESLPFRRWLRHREQMLKLECGINPFNN